MSNYIIAIKVSGEEGKVHKDDGETVEGTIVDEDHRGYVVIDGIDDKRHLIPKEKVKEIVIAKPPAE